MNDASAHVLEHVVKAQLAAAGIEIPAGMLADNRSQAEKFAETVGAPIVMKVVARGLVHKSRVGGVRLGVPASRCGQVFDELEQLAASSGHDFLGVLCEEMLEISDEYALGAVHHPTYGPLVMFGHGGTRIELDRNVVFAMAPVTEATAHDLIGRSGVTGPGGSTLSDAVSAALVDAVMAIAGPGGVFFDDDHDELEVNPLCSTSKGLVAVDARAFTGVQARRTAEAPSRGSANDLEPVLHPQSIVVVGASSTPGKVGYRAVRNLEDFGYVGALHGVRPSGQDVGGVRVVRSIEELPFGIDRAVLAIPAAAAPEALEELVARGVKSAHIFSSGFGEGSAEGASFGDGVRKVVENSQIRVLGPNSNGIYAADERITMIGARHSSVEPGGVSFVTQSGTFAADMVRHGTDLGIGMASVVSAGNCLDLDPTDYMRYLAQDDRTSFIAMYVEDLARPRSFFLEAERCDKPIVLLMGGTSGEGSRASHSHTGALAHDAAVIASLADSSGVVLVDDFDRLLHLVQAFDRLGPLAVERIAMLGSGGGVAVVAADMADRAGLRLARFTSETDEQLKPFVRAGSSLDNPIDIPIVSMLDADRRSVVGGVMEAVATDPNVDATIAYIDCGTVFDLDVDERSAEIVRGLNESVVEVAGAKPLVMVLRPGGSNAQDALVRSLTRSNRSKGVPTYRSVHAGVGALADLSLVTTASKRAPRREAPAPR